MTDEVKASAAVDEPASDEKRYPDPYGLYRMWFDVLQNGRDEENEGSVSPTELRELWRRWFETMVGTKIIETENPFLTGMGSLWSEMAEDISAKMLSEETLPEDPLAFFLRWYEATSEKWSKKADDLLKQDVVLESMSRLLGDCARSYGEFRGASEETFKNLQLPARSDITRVAKLVRTVEDKVDRIEEAFDEFIYGDSEPATAEAVGSLEERMERLEGKMDRMLAVLERLGTDNDLNPLETPRRSTQGTDKISTPLEGISLGLIEAGYLGAGSRGVVEAPRSKGDR